MIQGRLVCESWNECFLYAFASRQVPISRDSSLPNQNSGIMPHDCSREQSTSLYHQSLLFSSPSLPLLSKPHHSSRFLLPLPLRSAMPFVRAASRARSLCFLRAPARRMTPVLSSRPAFSTTARRCSDDPHAEETFEEFSAR